jgi:hypothetical protein
MVIYLRVWLQKQTFVRWLNAVIVFTSGGKNRLYFITVNFFSSAKVELFCFDKYYLESKVFVPVAMCELVTFVETRYTYVQTY